MYQKFDILDRKIQARLFGNGLGQVDCGERGVECEVEAVFVARLAVGQAGELLPVAVQELDTEAGAVNPVDVLAREGQVGGEEDLSGLRLLVRVVVNGDDHTDGTLEADGIDQGGVERHCRFPILDDGLLEHVLSRVVDVNVAVERLRPAGSALLGSVVEVPQPDVVAEAAHEVEGKAVQAGDEGPLGEVGISHHQAGQAAEPVGDTGESPEVKSEERVGVVHVGEVVGDPSLPLLHEGLRRREEHRQPVGGVHQCHAEDLKAALGCVGRARPEVAQSWRPLSRLRDVARVEGYRPEVTVSNGGQSRVEGHPVEPLLEVLPEAALARRPEPRHLAEVDASGYGA